MNSDCSGSYFITPGASLLQLFSMILRRWIGFVWADIGFREAGDAFDGDLSMADEAILETLADTIIKTTQEVVEKIDAIEKQLDETHAMLEAK